MNKTRYVFGESKPNRTGFTYKFGIIGIEDSLESSIAKGTPIMYYNQSIDLYGYVDPDTSVTFASTLGTEKVTISVPKDSNDVESLSLVHYYTLREVYEKYQTAQKEIDSITDAEFPSLSEFSVDQFLELFQAVSSYFGWKF